ncbi:UNVERIFIED_CONTAM: hypothetical protein FKN15_058511 [Acipenser sinensis]
MWSRRDLILLNSALSVISRRGSDCCLFRVLESNAAAQWASRTQHTLVHPGKLTENEDRPKDLLEDNPEYTIWS